MNGLDDLRGGFYTSYASEATIYAVLGWTLGGAIQSHIDVYVSQETFIEVQRSFPYLVAKEFASGGGDVRTVIASQRLFNYVTHRRCPNSNGILSTTLYLSRFKIQAFMLRLSQVSEAFFYLPNICV